MQTPEPDVLFVYGTLRRGCCNHKVLRRLRGRFLAGGHARGTLYDLGEYPGATRDGSGAAKVWGEIYLLPSPRRALKVLDKLEGFDAGRPAGSQFRRETTTVILCGGGRLQAWIYWLGEVLGARRRLPSGKYRQRGD
ncbi:MAG TPA: gamma-glutamylcyclotransferase family protein [Terriglobia bacterium]|nr:gamma-glutamylcyclotransferase family protein [Terriglobia bacterium]